MILERAALPYTVAMPVRRYVHPETGGRVTFVGMIHAAQPRFFASVGALLEQLQRDGATVFMEAQAQASADQLKYAKRGIRRRALALRAAYDAHIRWAMHLGLALPRDHLLVQPDWELPDEPLVERGRSVSWWEAVKLNAGALAVDRYRRTVPLRTQKEYFVQSITAGVRQATDLGLRDTRASPMSLAMEVWRESRGLAALDQRRTTEPGCHVVLSWGAMHLPRLELALTGRGYQAEGGDQWLTAIDVPSFMADAVSGGSRNPLPR